MDAEPTESKQAELHVKNMLSRCCEQVIRQTLQNHQIQVLRIEPGLVNISFDPVEITWAKIKKLMQEAGFELITGREEKVVQQVKRTVIELIHEMNNSDSIARKSEYLVEKTGLSYQYLSKVFSKLENTTLEKYIIAHKIERIKTLIESDEYTLSEIAYMMEYSSVQYLSNQFKKETGYSVSEYKMLEYKPKRYLEDI